MRQNARYAADFQVGGTSHHCATTDAGIAKMINLMPVSTLKRANDPTDPTNVSNVANVTIAVPLCATGECSPDLLVAGVLGAVQIPGRDVRALR